MKLTVIILNWNAGTDTIACISQLLSWQRLRPKIIVVDNASTDGSVQAISAACPQIQLIRNQTNQGYGGGNNRGLEVALGLGDAPILLLNNDAQIGEDDTIKLLETLQSHHKIGLIGPLLYDGRQKERLLAAGSKDPARHHHSHSRVLPAGGPVHLVECVPGTAIIGRAELFSQIGLLDEAYFFGSEIADLCLRARQQGFASAIDSRARVYHTLERSSTFRRTLYPYYIIRNRFLLIRKFHRRWKWGFYAFWSLYSLALSLRVQLSGNSAMAKAILLGLQDGLQARFGGQNERILAVTGNRADKAQP